MLSIQNQIAATLQDEVLYINPSPTTTEEIIYLTASKSSWLTISWLSEALLHYTQESYNDLFELHPSERGKIVMANEELISPRWHRSYLHQPERVPNPHGSYMYSGKALFADLSLPTAFQPILDFINLGETTHQYNQVVANWYQDGKDYIAPHSDCQKQAVPNTGIAIVTLCQNNNFPRELRLHAKTLQDTQRDALYKYIKIPLHHGSIITMHGDTQAKFRHSVPKDHENPTSRISLTFRKY